MRTMLTNTRTYIHSKIAQLQQEYRDLRQYILHDTSLEADFTRAVIAAIIVVIVGTCIIGTAHAPATLIDTDTGANII